ncbi:hypothetical protein K503DRAFT_294028 [Rhizopogon vinicolor AM-OR11-026]|uniref:Heterokaryon incompatibility domain-containing protein n=1 Tax=Rhizopogon vinicolor AM-OR11-026 TaxID=1314800 RepID=A0A1B7ND21_9AGAM|nr:hypothetical protein K503DRAFT_294028 [Rhizopogon vinicolor AM-OR11-026]
MSESTVIYSAPLHSLGDAILDISSSATSRRVRLLDCAQFLDDGVLAIHEFPEFPSVPYTATSYVWKGLGIDPAHADDYQYGAFTVKGAEDGDPISIDVLQHVCTVAVQNKTAYIWLDRVCILQNNRDDKAWQIRQMFNIYKSCAQCVVLPGGLRRLAQFDEETSWIRRSWTLQEIMAQSNVLILYAWKYGKLLSWSSASALFMYTEVIQGKSAICSLDNALQVSIGSCKLTTEREKFQRFSFKLLGRGRDPHVGALLAVLNGNGIDSDASAQAVWRCSLMRTSSFPVDTVLSIMGLFGVTLDPRSFNKGDRRGATIALAKEIIRNGRRANWLAPSISLPPAKGLSAFPEFPHVSVAGQATLTTKEGDRPVEELMPWVGEGWLDGVPTGTMDDAGYFTFSGPAALVVPTGRQKNDPTLYDNNSPTDAAGQLQAIAVDGSIWRIQLDGEETYQPPHPTFIVFVGFLVHYTSPSFGCYYDPFRYRALLIEEYEPGKFRRTSYFVLHEAYQSSIERWQSHTFCLGGPV